MDPAGWLLWSLGLSYVDLCSQLAWEDTWVSLQAELPATGWKLNAVMDSAFLRRRDPRAVGSGPGA